ncbi:Transmembrane prolyl 4-hydroxylase [Thelohanellus kitauei]|uniref:Transmembrane prolyl 4-hydroxylase n=1 Tax=Thelohanellus kitauei TaxID=669202 RepID=A0A0C2MBI4_THEKT|nr:Transmembrane prolyl 4-hydroxylase [Thelohanellus kitauei]
MSLFIFEQTFKVAADRTINVFQNDKTAQNLKPVIHLIVDDRSINDAETVTLRTFTADVSTLNSTSDVQELGESHKGSCQTNANLTSQPSESTETSEHIKLHRWDPVRVGFEREIQLEVGKTHKIVTMSVRPPVFVIENYMEDFECDHIISKAQKAGLFSSQLHLDANIIQLKSKRGHIVNYVSNLDNFDFNQDGKLNLPEELLNMAYFVNYLYLSEKDVQDILEKFEIVISEEDGHNYVSRQDFRKINHQGLAEYLEYLREYHPRHRDRHSDQVWLDAHDKDDEIMAKLMRRLEIATGLHKEILHGTELIQVLRYSTHGHYHAHFDSQNKSSFPNFPCCHTVPFATADSCRLCR